MNPDKLLSLSNIFHINDAATSAGGANLNAEPNITQLIQEWQAGDQQALETLTPFVYDELKRLARRQMRREYGERTLQATALVNEAFLKLAKAEIPYENRTHFYHMAASMMRRIMVDYARQRNSAKRGGKVKDLTFEEGATPIDPSIPVVLDLDLALGKLEKKDPKLCQAVELIYFGGLTYDEAAKVLGLSRTVFYEELQFAKAWLQKELA